MFVQTLTTTYMIAALGTFLVVILAFIVFMVITMWKIFEKAGQPGWAAIIPIYNMYILTKMAQKPGYWTILMIIPYVGLIWSIWCWNLISKKFGKDEGFTVGIVLLPIVFLPILAFGSAVYQGGAAGASTGTLDEQAFR
jgi:Family of unknown function (DUF5684)